MNPATSRKLVLVSLAAMGAVALARHAQGTSQGSTYKRVWAIGALGLLLTAAADFVPQIAGPLALLIGLTYVVGGQDALTNVVHGAIGTGQSSQTQAPQPKGGTP